MRDMDALRVLDQHTLTIRKSSVKPFTPVIGLVNMVVVNVQILNVTVSQRCADYLDLRIVVGDQVA